MTLDLLHLPGPQFLGLYVGVAVLVVWITWWLRRRAEAGPVQRTDLPQDPYEMAYLRGGKPHVIGVALFGLIDRNLLTVSGKNLKTADPDAVDKVRRPLDQAILSRFSVRREGSAAFEDSSVDAEAEGIGDDLRARGFLPNESQQRYRHGLFAISALLLVLLGGSKLWVALSEGRSNVLFLVVLTIALPFALWGLTHPFRTAAGQEALSGLKTVFADLKSRARNLPLHGMTNELVLLGAVFGLTALPAEATAILKPLKLHPTSSSGCGSGCAGGSSCSGGSCGGGCGGGCGGCGG